MSKLPVELMFALRYLKPKRTFVSVITMISIIGVMLGVAVLIIVISVMSGFDLQLREKLFGFNAHLRVEEKGTTMAAYRDIVPAIVSEPGVQGVAPYITGPILIETQTVSRQIAAPVLRGIDPDHEEDVSLLPESIIDGEFDVEGQGIVVGYHLARALGLRVGDPIAIYSHSGLQKVHQMFNDEGERQRLPLPDDYVVRGIFDVGYYEYDANVIVCSVFDAQELFLNGSDAVHGLFVMLDDPYAGPEVQAVLQNKLGLRFDVFSWIDDNSSLLNALVVEKNMIRFLLFFIVLVAAFGITNSQITFVVQKTKEIGMLKALGATSGQVLLIFLGQSFIVGVIGVAAGFGLGLLALQYRNEFLLWMNQLTGFNMFPPEIYGFSLLPAVVKSSDLWVICGGSLVICAVAGILPAINASRLRPVESLRHE
ncbi:MAG: Lipoprotein-releasing system transmembrane protein LolC [Verrucomicrobia subdivision 3 bacterium]|nr:Lipoprotein-releasing system transmembrane protein LolC [Limisphaerales bacterium]MCS1416609.1 Lipoprotein-releasing system transmembrane protein LolC [Limisphaerales bacterium]